jgi:hypothetical protein
MVMTKWTNPSLYFGQIYPSFFYTLTQIFHLRDRSTPLIPNPNKIHQKNRVDPTHSTSSSQQNNVRSVYSRREHDCSRYISSNS